LDTNPEIATNIDVANVGDKSSSWCTLWLPSHVMPFDHNEDISTITCCSNVVTTNPKQDVDTNPMVATSTNGGNVETSQVLGVHHCCQAMSCPLIRMIVLVQLNHA